MNAAPTGNGDGETHPTSGPKARKAKKGKAKESSLLTWNVLQAAARAAFVEACNASWSFGVALAAYHQSQAARARGGARGRGSGRGGDGARGGGLGAVGGGGPDSSKPGADLGLPDAPGSQAGENVVSGDVAEASGPEPKKQ
ncbi:uncharacterized protein N7506_011913 [Penicillium brevicompactum]|uniref:uncharacterized protein n=1 Tax=Penicillium brevicompactum TaxID=5074 RepID=UPI0025419229|nr:uncharacterized protein N7506_011913 [Penicillium brevicompactum]KAJ5319209.1 hypothetical protein N7506_011913 [Penicillium brevicompactum]